MFKYSKAAANTAFFICAAIFSLSSFNGCDDAGVETPKNNANVVSYDSIWVEEDSAGGLKLSAMDLFNGVPVNRSSNSRDINLNGADSNFYLQSAVFETKFFLVSASMQASGFDTIKAVYNISSPLDSADFTNWSTDVWSFFTAPMNLPDPHAVYCFWLKGRKDANQNNGKNIFGIIQPREAADLFSGPGGFRMSFRVRINKNGDNDFNEIIQ